MAKETNELQFDLELEGDHEALFVQMRNMIFNYSLLKDLDEDDGELAPLSSQVIKTTFPTKNR